MIEKKDNASTSQDHLKDSLDAKIKKSLNSSIAYGLTTIGLLIVGLYLNSQSSIDQSQILQYTRSIIFALTMPFAIATTSSFFDYQSSQDFPSSATKNQPRALDYYKTKSVTHSQTKSSKSTNNKLPNKASTPKNSVKKYCVKKLCDSNLNKNKSP